MWQRLTHVESGTVLAAEVVWARSAWARARGLIGTSLPPGQALVIEPAKQVHSFFMSGPIDVVFCDADWCVLHVVHRLRPWRITRWVSPARYVVELPAGKAGVVAVGDRLSD